MKLVLLFGLISVIWFLFPGLVPTHDGEYHVIRFYEFDKTFKGGDWYPRWAPDLNYGYGVPLFNYVYPLPNYVAFLLHFLGFSFINSFKLEMFIALILGAMFFYLWAKGYWGYWGGMVGAIFYTYSPYHFVDIYIRGSVGEVWALAFFPAFLWAITRYIQDKQKIFFILSSLFLSLIIFSHNILALMFFFFAVSYIIFLIYEERDKKYLPGGRQDLVLNTLCIMLLGLGLSSIFWLPALFERQYVTGLEIFDVSRHFPDLYQLIIPSWGSGFSGENIEGQMSFQIGIANLTVVLLSLLSVIFIFIFGHSGNPDLSGASRISNGLERFWSPRRQLAVRPQNDGNASVIIFFLVWFFVIFFLMLKISLPIWQSIPFMNYFQFPWRLLSLEMLTASFLAGGVICFWKSKLVAAFLILFSVALSIGYAKPAHYLYRDDDYYITRSNFIDGTNSPGNVFNTIWFNQNLKRQSERIIIDKGKLKSSAIKPTSHSYVVSIFSKSNVTVNIAYFPSWTVFIDGKQIETRQDSNGLISFIVSPGNHQIEVKFKDTPIRTIANFVSLATFFFIVFYSIRWYNIARLLKNYGKN